MPAAYYNYNAYDTVATFMLWEALKHTAQPLSTDGKLLESQNPSKGSSERIFDLNAWYWNRQRKSF